MASISELLRQMKRAGFLFVKHRGNHDEWMNPATGRYVLIPRHKQELGTGIYRKILKDAGLR